MLHIDNDLHFRNNGFIQFSGTYNYITTFFVVMNIDLHIFLRLYYVHSYSIIYIHKSLCIRSKTMTKRFQHRKTDHNYLCYLLMNYMKKTTWEQWYIPIYIIVIWAQWHIAFVFRILSFVDFDKLLLLLIIITVIIVIIIIVNFPYRFVFQYFAYTNNFGRSHK